MQYLQSLGVDSDEEEGKAVVVEEEEEEPNTGSKKNLTAESSKDSLTTKNQLSERSHHKSMKRLSSTLLE